MKIGRICSAGLLLTFLLTFVCPGFAAEIGSIELMKELEESRLEEETGTVTDETDEIISPPDISEPEKSDTVPEFDEEQDEIVESADETAGLHETNDPDEELFLNEAPDPNITEMPDEEQEPESLISPNEAELQTETTQTPEIQVTVPQSGNLVVNPYGLPVEIDGMTTTEKIASSTMTLVNQSNVPVRVDASVIGRFGEGSEAFFVSEVPSSDSLKKELFLYLEFQNSSSGMEPMLWNSVYQDTENQILVTEETVKKQGVLTLEAAGSSAACGVFRLFGASTVFPEERWNETDNIRISVAFTFAAIPLEQESESESEDAVNSEKDMFPGEPDDAVYDPQSWEEDSSSPYPAFEPNAGLTDEADYDYEHEIYFKTFEEKIEE